MQNPYADDEPTPLPDQTPQSPQSQQSPQFTPSRSYSYLNEQYGQFGQPPSQSMPPSYQSYQPFHQPAPGQFQPPPATPTPTPTARPSRGLRTGAILALTMLLAVVFGVGLFAGWQFGRTGTISSPTSSNSSNTALQQGNTSSTVPALTGNNLEAVREAVVAKVRPAVVQVNVTTGNGNAIGSGVIIDARGYIVTNNHVVNGAQSLEVVLFDGSRLPAQLVGTDAADDLAVIRVTPPKNGLTTIRKMMTATTTASVPSASVALMLLSAAARAGVTPPSACASTTARSSVLLVGRNTVGPSAMMPMNRTSEARTQLVWEPCRKPNSPR